MPLPADARIQAAQSFVLTVRSARDFLQQQDRRSADDRYTALLARLTEARQLLRWNPAAGRPARFLGSQSTQGRALAERAQALATAHGLPQLRELIVRPHVLLYAHSSDRVLLLSLRHERQLEFRLAPP